MAWRSTFANFATSRSLRQIFCWPKHTAILVVRSNLAKWASASEWLVSFWRRGPVVGHRYWKDSTDVQKVEKKWHQWLEMRWKFPLNLCGDQRILWDPSDSSHKNKNKLGMPFCKSLKCWVGMAWWTRFVYIKNRSERRPNRKVGLRQLGKTILRTAFWVKKFVCVCVCVCVCVRGYMRANVRAYVHAWGCLLHLTSQKNTLICFLRYSELGSTSV